MIAYRGAFPLKKGTDFVLHCFKSYILKAVSYNIDHKQELLILEQYLLICKCLKNDLRAVIHLLFLVCRSQQIDE